MEKQVKDQPDTVPVDRSRRELLSKAGKAAWVTPTLAFLSFTAGSGQAAGPPNPPSPCLPNCPTESPPDTEGEPKRRPRRN